jgi:hypothetical protein
MCVRSCALSLTLSVIGSAVGGCGAVARDPSPISAPSTCCSAREDIARLDGRRVLLEGTYRTVFLTKSPALARELEDRGEKSRTAAIETACGESVVLEVSYLPEGARPAAEIARFEGKRVRVTGVLHLSTPEQTTPDGHTAQTMIGPYISVEDIREAPTSTAER